MLHAFLEMSNTYVIPDAVGHNPLVLSDKIPYAVGYNCLVLNDEIPDAVGFNCLVLNDEIPDAVGYTPLLLNDEIPDAFGFNCLVLNDEIPDAVGYRNWYWYWGHCCLINDLGSSPQPEGEARGLWWASQVVNETTMTEIEVSISILSW